MKTLLQNSEKERDKCWLLFKTSFMKPLVAHFTLEPLIISIASFFAVGACLINLISLMEADCAHKLLGRLLVEPLNVKRVCFVSKLVKLHFTNIIFIISF